MQLNGIADASGYAFFDNIEIYRRLNFAADDENDVFNRCKRQRKIVFHKNGVRTLAFGFDEKLCFLCAHGTQV